jgi:hypothetical protein
VVGCFFFMVGQVSESLGVTVGVSNGARNIVVDVVWDITGEVVGLNPLIEWCWHLACFAGKGMVKGMKVKLRVRGQMA